MHLDAHRGGPRHTPVRNLHATDRAPDGLTTAFGPPPSDQRRRSLTGTPPTGTPPTGARQTSARGLTGAPVAPTSGSGLTMSRTSRWPASSSGCRRMVSTMLIPASTSRILCTGSVA